MSISHVLVILVVATSIGLMLVRPRGIGEVWFVGSGAVFLVVTGLTPFGVAVDAVAGGSDVYFFLVGMMLLAGLARLAGVFDWLATVAVRRAQSSSVRLFTLLFLAGTAVTICMSNDATAVVLTPAVLVAVRKARVDPLPHLFGCALIANAASFALPISNPANLVVYDGSMPALGRWLTQFAVPSALAILSTYITLRIMFRKELRVRVELCGPTSLSHAGKLVLAGLALVIVVLLLASARGITLGAPTLIAALAVTVVVCFRERFNLRTVARTISWSTLQLVAALFVMVAAVERIGGLDVTRDWLRDAASLPTAAGALITSAAVGAANNLINNLPVGVIAGATVHGMQPSATLMQSIVIGVDVGPNLSVTGSLATLLWLLALRKEGVCVTFFDFLRVGVVAMPVALVVSILGAGVVHAFGTH